MELIRSLAVAICAGANAGSKKWRKDWEAAGQCHYLRDHCPGGVQAKKLSENKKNVIERNVAISPL